MPVFKLICEGITDQIVIESILVGHFNNGDIEVDCLQSLRDATDENKATDAGWHKVFEYCKSSVFRGAFQQEDSYIIIQIDTDIFKGDSVSEEYGINTKDSNGTDLTVHELINNVVAKFIETIGEDFYKKEEERIIFAISVDSIECWLLPLYYQDNRKSKTVNCLKTLNEALAKKEGFTIDAKNPQYYRKIIKPYQKQKTLYKYQNENLSFHIFIENVEAKGIVIEKEDW